MGGWDVHTHLIPPTVLAAAHRGEHGLSVDSGSLVVGSDRLPLRRLADPAALLRWIEDQGLDGAVVSVPPALFRYDAGPEWAELVNQGLRELATPQLRVLAHLPLLDPAAPGVAAGLAGEGVFSGFAIGTPSYAGLDPVWRVLDAAGAFTLIHPGASDDRRLDSFYLSNLLGNPYETGVAAASLVFADVPGRFPGIRFCLCHGGGVTAAVAGRWQRGIDTARPGIEPVSLPVSEALRRFYVDDLVHDDAVLELLTSTFGAERVLAGSDWPFPMGSDKVSAARSATAGELTRPLAKEVSAE
ncbi:amidohydrolase family protein [Kribbella jejuensis]|uniref:Aminocarboxymuconate-semialdehyde decarboxylase n=1 Tax=Kribbella jejuensis TaxID=236068 RepID=A0A542D9I8_9ACTN|nr:amidohydrolase family protein [Kribbella jejuensis]TQI99740.1 aminocarboxymuconate-semialdehyde decarboxylase [Kribbella jejuensis]